MKILTKQTLLSLVAALVLTAPAMGRAQDVETSCADCPNLRAAFSIENKTGVTIRYQVRWGDHAWKSITLENNRIETHSYPLGANGKAPAPHVRYDKIGGDGGFTAQGYHMAFHAVGYAGYGPARNTATPKRYYFSYGADHRTLNLFAF